MRTNHYRLPVSLIAPLILCAVVAIAQQPQQQPAAPATPSPSPADLAFRKADEALVSGKHTEARSLFLQFTGQFSGDPRVPDAHFLKGIAELKGGPEGACVSTWTALVATFPKSEAAVKALEQLVIFYGKQNNQARVDEMIRRLVTGYPQHPVTIRLCCQEADKCLAAKDYAGAIAWYKKVQPTLPGEAVGKLRFAEAMSSAAGADPISIIMEANRLLEANEVPLATSLYEEFIARQPSSPAIKQARTKLGWCYYLNEKLDDAEKEWQNVIRQGPADDPWVGESQWNMIRLLSGPKNQWEQAVSLCETVARNFPKQFRGQQALFTRAWLYWAHKRFDQARKAFDDLTTAFPDTAHHPPIKDLIAQCDKELSKKP